MKSKPKTLAVTGGAGFIGSHLVGSLLEDGYKVMVLDNFSSGKISNLADYKDNKNLTVIKADILDKKKLFKLLEGVDWLYHLATTCLRISIGNPSLAHATNSTGALNVCQASLAKKVKRLIYVSSSEVYGSARYVPMDENHQCEPTTVYAATKLAGEYYTKSFIRTYGLSAMIIRPFNTYGPREHFEGPYGEVIPRFAIRALGGMSPVVFGDGNQKRDFTYVTEIAHGIKKASFSDNLLGDTVNLAYGKPVSIKNIASIIMKSVGKKGTALSYKAQRPGDVKKHHADIKKAARLFGFEPKIDIKEGIKRYIEWLKKENLDFKKLAKESGKYNWRDS